MLNPLVGEDFTPLADYVNEVFDGHLIKVIRQTWSEHSRTLADRTIFLFHFLPENQEIPELERQNIVTVLSKIKDSMMESYFKQQGYTVTRFS